MLYSVLRLAIFAVVMTVLYLAGMRGMLLLVVGAMISAIISLVALIGPREQFARSIEARIQDRRARAEEHRTAEDED